MSYDMIMTFAYIMQIMLNKENFIRRQFWTAYSGMPVKCIAFQVRLAEIALSAAGDNLLINGISKVNIRHECQNRK